MECDLKPIQNHARVIRSIYISINRLLMKLLYRWSFTIFLKIRNIHQNFYILQMSSSKKKGQSNFFFLCKLKSLIEKIEEIGGDSFFSSKRWKHFHKYWKTLCIFPSRDKNIYRISFRFRSLTGSYLYYN